jgi:hypothetical protein
MVNPAYNKRREDPPIWEAPRVAELSDFVGLDDLDRMNIEIIFESLEQQKLLVFEYKGRDRLVAPFVFGVSQYGNALMRGYLIEGSSRSGKGPGWRVFQVREMSMVDVFDEWFYPEDFKFDRWYPWVYKVYKML